MGLLSGHRQLRLGIDGAKAGRGAWADVSRVPRMNADEEAAIAADTPRDPELAARQHLIMLLQAAAEIEHALLVQYLFAAYSLRLAVPIPNASGRTTSDWRDELLQIAKEEMGHLLCVQNCLRAVGGPNHFGRDNFPMHTGVYPFPFELAPLSLKSVARYVAAEMPEPRTIPSTILTQEQLARIASLSGAHVNRVGVLFALIKQAIEQLPDDSIRLDRDDWQEQSADWLADDSLDPPLIGVRVFAIVGGSAAERKARLLQIVSFIGDQGESPATAEPDSHFERFAKIFRELDAAGPFDPALPLVTNPNTTPPPDAADVLSPEEALREARLAPGRIQDPVTVLWAKLSNVRYRVLLHALAHSCASGPLTHPTTRQVARDELRGWAFQEMFTITPLADLLSGKPVGGLSTAHSGSPFELPYSVQIADRGPERWSTYVDLFDATKAIADALRAGPLSKPEKSLLDELTARDGADATAERRKTVAEWSTVDIV